MAIKERNQNLVVGDTARLRLFTLNSNEYANLKSINEIDVYFLDPTAVSSINPDGRTLFQTLNLSQLVQDSTGQYHIDVLLNPPQYVIGSYIDVWNVTFDNTSNCTSNIENDFKVFPNLWIASEKPLVYDFDFQFTPNRITQGSIKYLTVTVTPNVPRGLTLEKYYENLIISSDIQISIIQKCNPCLPQEEDLRTVVDGDSMTFKDGNTGYYLFDTTELDCGIYDVFFTLNFGNTVNISNRGQLEIYT